MEENIDLLGQHLRALFKDRDVTQGGAAEFLDIAVSSFSRKLAGYSKFHLEELEKLCDYLSLTDKDREELLSLVGYPLREGIAKKLEEQRFKFENTYLVTIFEKIRSLLEDPSAEAVKTAISQTISEKFGQTRNTPEEIAKFIVDLHKGSEGQTVNITIDVLLTIAIKKVEGSNIIGQIRSTFSELLGWLLHIAVADQEISQYVLPSGAINLPVSTKVAVEIFLARFSVRVASFKNATSLDRASGAGSILQQLEVDKVTAEYVKSKTSEILVSLYKFMEPTWEPDYQDREEYKLTPTELGLLRDLISSKKGSEEIYPYVMFQILSASVEDFEAVGNALRTLVPVLDVVGFGAKGRKNIFLIDTSIRASIKNFYEVLDRVFPEEKR